MPSEKLKPCPFCGGCAERIEVVEDDGFNNRGGSAVECQTCRASSHVEFGRKENLISSWNRRTAAEQAEPAPAARAGAVKVKTLEWSEIREPDDDIRYTHVVADSALGQWSIEWKSWKKYDDYTIFLDGYFVANGGHRNLDDAKMLAQNDYERRILSSLEPAEPATDAEQSSDWLRDTAMDVMLCTEVEKATRTLSLAMSRSPRPPESRLREALPALKAIAEGYKALGVKDRFIKVENPDFKEDDGSNPFLIIDVTALAQGADDGRA